MGCIYACSCSGRCYDCSEYQREKYVGHAEDILAQANGYRTADEWTKHQNQVDYQQEQGIEQEDSKSPKQ